MTLETEFERLVDNLERLNEKFAMLKGMENECRKCIEAVAETISEKSIEPGQEPYSGKRA